MNQSTRRFLYIAALVCLAKMLAACATPSPAPVLPPPACTALTLQPVVPQPRLPDGATVPEPTTEADAEGLRLFLNHAATLAAWGREGWARVEAQQRACADRPAEGERAGVRRLPITGQVFDSP
jgi:hypothetical protein